MANRFDEILSAAVAPPERDPDRLFVAQVQQRIRIEERLDAERAAIFRRLGVELIALLAAAGGLALIASAPAVAEFVVESPAMGLAATIGGFALLLAAMQSGGGRWAQRG